MITYIGPEPGGEDDGYLRVELSVPFTVLELSNLGDWFALGGWSEESGQITDYLAGKDWRR